MAEGAAITVKLHLARPIDTMHVLRLGLAAAIIRPKDASLYRGGRMRGSRRRGAASSASSAYWTNGEEGGESPLWGEVVLGMLGPRVGFGSRSETGPTWELAETALTVVAWSDSEVVLKERSLRKTGASTGGSPLMSLAGSWAQAVSSTILASSSAANLRRRRNHHEPSRINSNPATPPTTPPTMAPVGELPLRCTPIVAGCEVCDVSTTD